MYTMTCRFINYLRSGGFIDTARTERAPFAAALGREWQLTLRRILALFSRGAIERRGESDERSGERSGGVCSLAASVGARARESLSARSGRQRSAECETQRVPALEVNLCREEVMAKREECQGTLRAASLTTNVHLILMWFCCTIKK